VPNGAKSTNHYVQLLFHQAFQFKKKGRASLKLLTGELCRKIGHFGNGE